MSLQWSRPLLQEILLGSLGMAGLIVLWGFLDGSVVNNLPANQETQEMCFRSLGWQDPLEKEMATHSSILPWRIPRTEEPGGLQSMGLQRVGQD